MKYLDAVVIILEAATESDEYDGEHLGRMRKNAVHFIKHADYEKQSCDYFIVDSCRVSVFLFPLLWDYVAFRRKICRYTS